MKSNRSNSGFVRTAPSVLGLVVGLVAIVLWIYTPQGSAANEADVSFVTGFSQSAILSGVILFSVIGGILSAARTALASLRPMHLRLFKEEGDKRSAKIEYLINNQDHLEAALSFGAQTANLGLVFCGFLFAPVLAQFMEARFGWHNDYGLVLASGLAITVPLVLVSLIVSDLVPKSYAELHPIDTSLRLYRFTKVSAFLFSAPASLTTLLAGMVTSRFGGKARFKIANQAEVEIKTLVESAQESGEIEHGEKELLHSVFEFADTVAREVMTPRVDLDAVPVSTPSQEVIDLIQKSGHSRIPLYEGTDDQIIGIVHAKDLLLASIKQKSVDLRALMRPALFVPENKSLQELLAEMRTHKAQLAIVQDEFGGTAGIVTIEDIVEELVGDIVDEYDIEEPDLIKTSEGHLVNGKLHVDDLNHALGSEFDSQEFDTVGGFVFGLFGRQPKPEDEVIAEGYTFKVIETDGRRILKLMVSRISSDSPHLA